MLIRGVAKVFLHRNNLKPVSCNSKNCKTRKLFNKLPETLKKSHILKFTKNKVRKCLTTKTYYSANKF